MRSIRSITLFTGLCIFSILLASCGGGGNDNPYDGTWTATYPPLSKDSTITDAKTVVCTNPGTAIVINNYAGTTRITASCTSTLFDTSTTPPTQISTNTQTNFVDVGVSIEVKPSPNQKDVLNALVNGAAFTGTCISTSSCSAASEGGDTLSLIR